MHDLTAGTATRIHSITTPELQQSPRYSNGTSAGVVKLVKLMKRVCDLAGNSRVSIISHKGYPCHNISSLFHLLEDSPFVSFDCFFHMLFPTYLIMCSYHFVHTRTSFSRCSASRSVDNLAVHPLRSLSDAFIPCSLRSLSHLLSMLTHQLTIRSRGWPIRVRDGSELFEVPIKH